MTITSDNNRIQYTGNGATDTYSTGTIKFYDATDLIVTETIIATGVDTVYALTTDYTVTGGNGATGSITLVAGSLPSTKRITIERAIPYTQSSDYVEGETILAEEIETSLDKVVIMTQQLKDAVDRSVKLPSSTTASSIALPNYSAGLLLGWSASTPNVLVNSSKTVAQVEAAVDAVAALSSGSGVLVSSNDTTVGYLNGKLVAGSNITLTENNDGSNETLTIAATNTTYSAGTGLSLAGTTFNLANTAVTPGSYTAANITVDAQGRITAAANGSSNPTVKQSFTSLSGATQDITIPSGVEYFEIYGTDISYNGASGPIAQLGDAGGVESSGYVGNCSDDEGTSLQFSGAFRLGPTTNATDVWQFVARFTKLEGNKWMCAGNFARTDSTFSGEFVGYKTLSDTLTTVRIAGSAGSNFDAGQLYARY